MAGFNNSNTRRQINAVRHIVMGIILIACAYALIEYRYFARIELNLTTAYVLGGILVVYGLFRMWRGIQDLRGEKTDDFIS